MQIIYTLFQTDNLTSISSLIFTGQMLFLMPNRVEAPNAIKITTRTMYVSQHPQLRTGGFYWSKFYCLHDLADGN